MVDIFDSLFDGDSGPAGMDLKVIDQGVDEARGLKCSGSDAVASKSSP